MSAEESRKVVSRAVMEEDFRNQLFSDPDTALVGYDLTPEEQSQRNRFRHAPGWR